MKWKPFQLPNESILISVDGYVIFQHDKIQLNKRRRQVMEERFQDIIEMIEWDKPTEYQ